MLSYRIQPFHLYSMQFKRINAFVTLMGTEKPANRTHTMTIRLPSELFQQVEKRADSENRSRSNLVITYLSMVLSLSPEELKQMLDSRRRRRKSRNGR